MFQKIIIGTIIILAVILQVSVLPVFFSANLVPDIVLALVVFWTVQNGFNESWTRILTSGLVVDIFAFSSVGLAILSLTLGSFATSFLAKRFLVSNARWKFFIIIIIVSVATGTGIGVSIFLKTINFYAFSSNVRPLSEFPGGWNIFYKTILNAILFFLLYYPLIRIEKIINRYKQRKFRQSRFMS